MAETELAYADVADLQLYPEFQIASAAPESFAQNAAVTTFTGPERSAALMDRVELVNNLSNDRILEAFRESQKQSMLERSTLIADNARAQRADAATRTAEVPDNGNTTESAEKQKGDNVLKEVFAAQGVDFADVEKGMGATGESLSGIEQAKRNIETARSNARSQGAVTGDADMKVDRELAALDGKEKYIKEAQDALGAGALNIFNGQELAFGDHEPEGQGIGLKIGKEIEAPEVGPERAAQAKTDLVYHDSLPAHHLDTGLDQKHKQGGVTQYAHIESAEVGNSPMDEMLKKGGFKSNELTAKVEGADGIPGSSPALGFGAVRSTGMGGRGMA